jgi:polyphenol oxidase
MAGAERFHGRFLRSETGRIRGRKIALRSTVGHFTVGEDTPQKAVAVAVDHVRNALDFGGVQTDTYNFHARFGSYMTLPPVPASFYWTNETWGAALRCRPLDPLAQHLFTTRQLPLPSRDAWDALACMIGVPPDRVVSLNQVHGREVVRIARDTSPQMLEGLRNEHPKADAVVSNARDVALVVRAADCVPLLIADARTGAVAAIHAGWRGTAVRVGVAAIEEMQRQFGSQPADLVVAIGPAIGPCCYEVGSDLVDAFAAAGHERYLIDRWFMTPRERRMRLDLVGANRDQLILAGVREEQIHACGLCTAMHLDVFTSYRVEQSAARRIAGAIRASKPPASTTAVHS